MVTGINGVVGGPLYDQCCRLGWDVTAVSRYRGGNSVLQWDMNRPAPDFSELPNVLIHTAPLWLLPRHLRAFADGGVKRIVCFSSTSVLTKMDSSVRGERELADALKRAEDEVMGSSKEFGIGMTLFRPTLIYGYGRDQNVSMIARFARKYGFFPVAGRGAGRRQPLAAADAVKSALAVVPESVTEDRSYTLVGGETLTYRDMVIRIVRALDKPARVLQVPARLLELLLSAASLAGAGYNGAMAVRMNQDLVFDSSAAARDFGFKAEKFLEHPDRDLCKA